MSDSASPDGIELESHDVIEFFFGDFSVVFDRMTMESWAEFADDETDDIDIEPSIDVDAALASLPEVEFYPGERGRLTRASYDEIRSIAFASSTGLDFGKSIDR